MNTEQIKTKRRVADHGEVFTSDREVNAMLDLVKQETERIDSRFLEPACGNGNFLIEILRRKLKVVKSRYRKNATEYEKYAIVALTSIYGVDILLDNVQECRSRLFVIFDKEYTSCCKEETNDDCREAAKFILGRNILCGDALTLKTNDNEPIIFSEWSLVTGNLMKRRDFRLDEMMDGHAEQMTLFMSDWEYDEEIQAFIPKPIREFPLVHYRKVHQND
ncbi:MAG: SAM-dependent DNA methyltransferase [Clostridia bacterium]|nr:SAM-dependent DNA methyltransferase [Clostridia bacterium]